MFLRREAVHKTGLPDESFFMYGEDIDYSYRILKEGYKNYYYPGVKILHFKGESTKKENIDFVVNFYKAMLIFVRKHFNDGNFKRISFAIHIAVFFRAGLSVMHRFLDKIFKLLLTGFTSVLHPLKGHERTVRTVIVSDTEGYGKVKEILISAGIPSETLRISTVRNDPDKNIAGTIYNLNEILKGNRIGQVIFTSGRMNASGIIDSINSISDRKVTIRIASAGEKFIISSGSVTKKRTQSI
jgi:hypothetical protein